MGGGSFLLKPPGGGKAPSESVLFQGLPGSTDLLLSEF